MSEPARPRFTVVVPAYNEEHYLGATLTALLAQDFPGAYEVVVVDNNSDDATAEVARAYGVEVVAEPVPGVCSARQRGSAVARGEIIVSTDADTLQPVDWLSRIDAAFAADPSVVAVGGPCRFDGASWWMTRWPSLLFGMVDRVAARTGRVLYVSATNLAMTREAFPGYDVHQTQGGDELDLLRRLRPQGRVVWDSANVVTTSARRLERGLAYSLFGTLLTYYLLSYAVNRLSGRRWLGEAPVYRESGLAPRPQPARVDKPGRTERRTA